MTGSLERIVVHDFSGHPFQAQLAREMAKRGFDTTHLYCPSFQTPKGNVGDEEHDVPESAGRFRCVPVGLFRPFAKYQGGRRLFQELEYGIRAGIAIAKRRPQVVLTANTPLIAAFVLQLTLLAFNRRIVFWQQDVYSVAMAGHLERKAGPIGRLFGKGLIRIEKWLLRSSDHVVVISEDFLDTLAEWDIDLTRVSVVENWAPLDELPLRSRRNEWSMSHGIEEDDLVYLYAGSLGLKHEPSLLLDLARSFDPGSPAKVIVASEGRGAQWLEREMTSEDPIQLLPFQDYDQLPNMLASADVLLVLLEPDAGGFSVPSKVLTYHCAGRPILGAMPYENLAARIIGRNESGIVVGSGDSQRFASEAKRLSGDPELRRRMGANGRAYAEQTFDIEHLGRRFEAILTTGAQEPVQMESYAH